MSAATIHLIVNADDLGAGAARDRGIVRAFREGIVTSASLLANGPSFPEAARQARELAMPVGVHLNLSEGPALGGPIAGLTDAAGRFPGKEGARRALAAGTFDKERAETELRAQVEAVLAAGIVPDHLDTHQHCSLFPAVTPLLLATAAAFGIGSMRFPLPVEAPADDPGGPLGEEVRLYRRLAPRLAATLGSAGLRTPEGLFGMPFLDRLDTDTLCRLLERLPPGVWELMVHPGYADPRQPFSGVERERELAALLAPAVRQVVTRREIRLITFGELPCAS